MTIRHYVLFATDGYINLPLTSDTCNKTDTERIYIFGFTGGLFKVEVDGKVTFKNDELDWEIKSSRDNFKNYMGKAAIPSPLIWAEQGDHLYITLINLGMFYRPDLMDPHTVHIHGGHVATQLDGFPETSFGVPMWMKDMELPPMATYYFKPENPGTLMYHCHVEASEHVQMGMYGAIIIYPSMESLKENGITKCSCGYWCYYGVHQKQISKSATNRNFAYNDINTYFEKDYIMLLSDIDSKWHRSVEHPDIIPQFNPVDFKPDFWLINGRAFPDTILPFPPETFEDPNAPINYDSYVHVKTNQKFLLRMINMGYQVVPWHIHGWHFTVLGKDSHMSPFIKIAENIATDHMSMHQMYEMGFTATIGSGETYDLLLTADDKSPVYKKYITKGQDSIPALCCQMKKINDIDPTAIADIPTEPVNCVCTDPSFCRPQDTVNYVDICCNKDKFFPQFYPMHNHDDYKVTNNGKYPGGQLTLIQTDAHDYCCCE